ncbi:MAG: thiazole synthase, partial [Candidatus Electrothrix sp. AS4_5]|nr:thiazole synthase [Candidatus Electrothrix gigas]
MSTKKTEPSDDTLYFGDVSFSSRLLTGTGKFSSRDIIAPMLEASGSELITVALRRVDPKAKEKDILQYIPKSVRIL